MSRPRRTLELTDEERRTLQMWVNAGKTENRMVKRAQTIRLATSELSWDEICAQTGLNRNNSLKWVRRFRAECLDSLKGGLRVGRSARYSAEEKVAVMALSRSQPELPLAPDSYLHSPWHSMFVDCFGSPPRAC